MIYRKQSPTPPRLLLRIVGTAGAGTLLGMAACGSNPNIVGSTGGVETNDGGMSSDGASDSAPDTIVMGSVVTGSVACPADGSDVVGCPGTFPDASDDAADHGISGSVVCPPDASGIQGCPVVTGLVVSPSDASDDVIVNGLVAHPGDSG
jgi:hypothetical protein